jgi:hypothetical protein
MLGPDSGPLIDFAAVAYVVKEQTACLGIKFVEYAVIANP